jgi:hypothetical protein
MNENRTAFIEYIDEIASEIIAAHTEAKLQLDIKSYIGNLDQLAQFTHQLPSNINLYNTNNLLSIDNELYVDLVQPALLKRLAITN